MPDHHRPVFVDPSGRRRRVMRNVAITGAALTVGYLALVLLAAFGGPGSPAARLPLLPNSPAAADLGPAPPLPAILAPSTGAGPTPTSGPAASTAAVPAGSVAAGPATTTSRHGKLPIKPSEPPASGRPTDPPGNG